jgi:hypothetical protein
MNPVKFCTTTPYKLHVALENAAPKILDFAAEVISDTISNIVRERYSSEEADQIIDEACSHIDGLGLEIDIQFVVNAFSEVSAIKEELAEFLEQVPEHKDI